jgi:hypothetical protein
MALIHNYFLLAWHVLGEHPHLYRNGDADPTVRKGNDQQKRGEYFAVGEAIYTPGLESVIN